MMVAVRLGLYPDLAACCREWVDPLLGELEPPDPALVRRYDALFPVYRAGYETMFGVWRDLDHARREDTDHA